MPEILPEGNAQPLERDPPTSNAERSRKQGASNGRLPSWSELWRPRAIGSTCLTYVSTIFMPTSRRLTVLASCKVIQTAQLQISAQEKLTLLRRVDRWRLWKSLDDQRLCLGCGRLINGHEIDVVPTNERVDSVEVHCPTAGCQSIALDWILPHPSISSRK